MIWLDRSDAQALSTYSYKGQDNSLISKYVLQPYWSYIVHFVPLWVHPNILTLLGLICSAVAYFFIFWTTAGAMAPAPAWTLGAAGVLGFAYQTLDALDGKQARRTGMSGALGEIFDHACDSLNVSFSCLITMAGYGIGVADLRSLACLLVLNVVFFGSCWEYLHTQVLLLPVINGPVEGHLIAILSLLATAAIGDVAFWARESPIAGLRWMTLPVGFMVLAAGFTFLLNVRNVVLSEVSRTRSVRERLAQPSAVIAFAVAAWLWAKHSPAGVFQAHPHLFCLCVATTQAHITDRVHLAHLTHRRFESPWWLVAVPVLAALNWAVAPALLGGQAPVAALTEHTFLWVWVVMSAVTYAISSVIVVRDLCEVLNTKAFTVIKRK
jgi:ethanolaminephosphotransferase